MIKYITQNRSYLPLLPMGIVIHETATPGATAENEYNYFNSGDHGASAHAFVDWNGYINPVPYTEIAWHAGPTANSRYIGIEMCRPNGFNKQLFERVWENTVILTSQLCKRFDISEIISHADASRLWGETNHTDPVGYFREYGKTMDDFRSDVMKILNGDELDMTQYEELKARIEELENKTQPIIYNYIDENMPSWARPTIQKLVNQGILAGTETGLRLTDELLRTLVIMDRMIN